MWLCPQCGLEVEDSLKWCWICGTSPDGTEYPRIPGAGDASELSRQPLTRKVIRRIGALRRRLGGIRLPKAAGVPRRFSLGRLMLITAFFAVLFGLLSWLDAHPILFVAVGVFVVLVGLAQVFLFSGKKPRKASVVAGSAVGALIVVVGFLVDLFTGGVPFGDILFGMFFALPVMTGISALLGGVLGYMAGCLIAGVFLGKRVDLPEADDRRSETPDPLCPEGTELGSPEDPPAE